MISDHFPVCRELYIKVKCELRKNYIEICRPLLDEACLGEEKLIETHNDVQANLDADDRKFGKWLGELDYKLPKTCGTLKYATRSKDDNTDGDNSNENEGNNYFHYDSNDYFDYDVLGG